LEIPLEQNSANRELSTPEVFDVDDSVLNVDVVPREEPLVGEALPFNVQHIPKVQFERRHLRLNLRLRACQHMGVDRFRI
jgi:hypothetical protein